MNLFILLISLFTLVSESSFAMGRGVPTPNEETVPTPTPITVETPSNEDNITGGLSVVIRKSTNFDTNGVAKLEAARAIVEPLLNSQEFKQRVLHHRYEGVETYVQNNGLTNLQIYKVMMRGAEALPAQTAANQTLDFFAQLYYSRKNVIGYTYPTTSTIYMNSRYFNTFTPGEVASNMIHEWLHKLGFDHDYNYTSRRPFSVPYAIGDIVDQMLAKQQLN